MGLPNIELGDEVVPVRVRLTRTQVFETTVHLNPVIPMHNDVDRLKASVSRMADEAARFEWHEIDDHIEFERIEAEEVPDDGHHVALPR